MKDLLDKLTPGKKTKGIETWHTEKIGPDGKYDSLITVKTRSISSKSTPEEIDEFNKGHKNTTLLEEIEESEELPKYILRNAGLPTHWNVEATHKEKIKTGSAPYFAAEALCYAFMLKKALTEDNTKSAVYAALRFQACVNRLVIKEWEYPARYGEKEISRKRKSNEKHTKEDKAEWVRIAKERKRDASVPRNKKKSTRQLALFIADEFSVSLNTVYDHLKKNLK